MKLQVKRDSILVIPESPQDEVFLEEKFGLKKDRDIAVARRVTGHSGQEWGHLVITRGIASEPSSSVPEPAAQG